MTDNTEREELVKRLIWHAEAFEQAPDALIYSAKSKVLREAAAALTAQPQGEPEGMSCSELATRVKRGEKWAIAAQPQQEPVAQVVTASATIPYPHIERLVDIGTLKAGTKLYTAPQPGVREGMLRADDVLRSILDTYNARSELFINDSDLAGNMADRARRFFNEN